MRVMQTFYILYIELHDNAKVGEDTEENKETYYGSKTELIIAFSKLL